MNKELIKYRFRAVPRKWRRLLEVMGISLIGMCAVYGILLLAFPQVLERGSDAGAQSSPAPQEVRQTPLNVVAPDWVTKDFLTPNEYSRPQTPLTTVNGIVVHYVGNPDTTATANRNYFEQLATTQDTYASSHFVVGLEGEIIQCIPLNEIAYCSNDRNSDTISIECCHPDAKGQFNDQTYASLIRLVDWLCDTYGLDPGTDVIRHYDVTGKECPKYYVDHPEAWTQFLADLSSAP